MTITNIILFLIFSVSNTWTLGQVAIESNDLNEGDHGIEILNNIYSFLDTFLKMFNQFNPGDSEKVSVNVYYEVFCGGCIEFDVHDLAPVVKTMSSYVDIKTYPFGNGRIIVDEDGKITIKCQNGPPECYGNKLHACALDSLNHTTALLYNICLMDAPRGIGSDDESADRCGKSMKIDSEKIKACAKGDRGMELLKYYGEESKKADFEYVPYVLVNGKEFTGDNFKEYVCAAFTNPPPPCKNDNRQ